MNISDNELISIVVPVYNVEKYLKRCLDSLVNQTYKNIEIILVNDGSTDSSLEICKGYAKKDSRVKIISKKNEGLGYTRNEGINIAKGIYIAFIDSDDYVDENFYEKLYVSAKKYNSDMVYASFKSVDKNNKMRTTFNIKLNKQVYIGEDIKTNILYNVIENNGNHKRLPMSACMILYKKEIIDKYNIRFLSERQYASEDLIFNLEFILKANTISIVNNAYYYYCYNQNSLTRKYKADRFKKVMIMYDYLKDFMKKEHLFEDTKKGINTYVISQIRTCIKLEKYNNKKDALNNLKVICENNDVQQILSEKYTKTMKQTFFDFLIKNKKYKILYFLGKIR